MSKQGRAVGGSCLGGVLGGVLGVILGGGIVIAVGSRESGTPFDILVGIGYIVFLLIGAGVGGLIGAIGGAAIGAGIATKERGSGSRKRNRPKRN